MLQFVFNFKFFYFNKFFLLIFDINCLLWSSKPFNNRIIEYNVTFQTVLPCWWKICWSQVATITGQGVVYHSDYGHQIKSWTTGWSDVESSTIEKKKSYAIKFFLGLLFHETTMSNPGTVDRACEILTTIPTSANWSIKNELAPYVQCV